jgi:hypothetical protein
MQLYDLADVGPRVVERAGDAAQAVFVRAGLTILWTEEDSRDPQAHTIENATMTNCPSALRSADLRVRLISHTPSSVPIDVLGAAFPCSGSGVQVSIYADHVQALSRSVSISTADILGYAIAHEVGHVLLRSNRHWGDGLMKARWSRADWQAVRSKSLDFSRDQADQMLIEVAKLAARGFAE